ncbi:DEAD/DEAH box helicase family protein [Moraxella sp. PS-22]|uniref:DEAD/DEAH box helicase family protein n=1 Tax=Moraxella tetraodonis TaxID=2767221 RepID=A0A9X1UTB9_9GAMM|nr:DEAD/DEAH box helicase family protein [Moraxella tetraodonis]MCG8148778.1 DEAD/DEAH box helicase family protein [Moraxella tetraodonis]
MANKTVITTTKQIYPQIYAYVTPNYKPNEGWVKIGYTDRQDVKTRINEQTKTVGIGYELLWSAPAKFSKAKDIEDWFKDKEFHTYLRQFKQVEQRLPYEWFYYNGTPGKARQHFDDFLSHERSQVKEELPYQLRQEQQDAIEQTVAYAKSMPEGEFLWNAKPRFGKTLTTYELARQLDAHKVLIVTNRPAIANSWFDDFEKFIAWQTDYAFVSESESLKDRPVFTRDQFLDQRANGKKRMIAFISLQDLKGSVYFGGKHVKHDWITADKYDDREDKYDWFKETPWDLLVIDEAHEGVDTYKTDFAFEKIKRKFTLHLSGTPFKALASSKFGADEIYNWTYADEQAAKAEWKDTEEENPYEKLPQLNLFSYQMSPMITNEVNKGANIDGENHDYAFDLNEFFLTNDSGKLVHEADVKKWLNTLTENHKYPFSTKELRDELKHTFWLLNRVASAKALQKLLKNHPIFENYEIILAAGDGRGEDDEQVISQRALDKVKEAIKNHDKTITLSVGQLTTGITIPEWTAVLMLSNLKSPSLYMQAAFRAQNPWLYEIDGEIHQKQNAYVFDFAPERTLTIYEEFANNLSKGTSGGSGTSDDRKANVRQLLNFFPVIAEDSDGQMVELDVDQVLTLPKVFKAQEVVRRGFMSNFLFQNVSGIFASEKARKILEQLNPVDVGKTVPRKTEEPIDTKGISVNEQGKANIDTDIVIATTEAKFGDKVYGTMQAVAEQAAQSIDITTLANPNDDLAKTISASLQQSMQETTQGLAKEQGLTSKFAEQVVTQSTQAITREIETVQKHSEIKQKVAEIKYQKTIAEAQSEPPEVAQAKIEEAKVEYEAKQQKIAEEFKQQVVETVTTKSQELAQQATQTILEKAEEKKKNTVEDDVRGRLRGFARTIPSFLMAYGTPNTTLANFDMTIKDEVFKEVTGITLDDFRTLRDEFNFFDETVFNQSVQEFLIKRRELANYFDDSQEEDIFDYIPPQETNQIFTPKWVVKMMIDKLEAEDLEIFKRSDKTFADLYVKSGLYLTEIVKRLYAGLADEIPDPDARLKHILERQIYGFAPSEIILNIARNFVFGFDEKAKNIDQSHIVLLDTIPYAKGETEISFEAKCDELFRGEK